MVEKSELSVELNVLKSVLCCIYFTLRNPPSLILANLFGAWKDTIRPVGKYIPAARHLLQHLRTQRPNLEKVMGMVLRRCKSAEE